MKAELLYLKCELVRMSLFKNKYRIESNRLKNWNYASNGMYFITICCANRQCLFGEIQDNKMILNNNGIIVSDEINKSIELRDKWIFHNWIIMPNHIHLLVEINDNSEKFNYSTKTILDNEIDIEIRNLFLTIPEELDCSPTQSKKEINENNNKLYRRPKSISSFVAQFKAKITKQINLKNGTDSVWQSNYHDSIIRSHEGFQKVYYYIQNNPKNWKQDSLK